MPAASPWYFAPSTIASRSKADAACTGMRSGSNVTLPMSTSAATTDPSASRETVTRRRPAAVSTSNSSPRSEPALAATHARQRTPLPLISARPPSAFSSVIVQSRTVAAGADRDEAVGADAAVAVAERRDHDRVERGLGRIERDLHQEVVPRRVELGEREIGHGAAASTGAARPVARVPTPTRPDRADLAPCRYPPDARVAAEPDALAPGESTGPAHGRVAARRRAADLARRGARAPPCSRSPPAPYGKGRARQGRGPRRRARGAHVVEAVGDPRRPSSDGCDLEPDIDTEIAGGP